MSTPGFDHGPKLAPPQNATSLPLIIVRLAVAAALPVGYYLYFWVDGDTAAPDTFSVGSWTLMLLPPIVMAVSLLSGLWQQEPHPTRRQLHLSRASTAIAALGLVLACSVSLLYFAGELFDHFIP